MFKTLVDDAKRCIHCKNPQCTKGCPVNTNIKDMIKMFLEGKIKKAGEMLYKNNPLSSICALVCPHEKLCEGHCVLAKKSYPVNIGEIEHYISDYYLNLVEFVNCLNPKKKIAIIGAGPAGITLAILLARKCYDITIFEAHDYIGGVLKYGIPDFRLPEINIENLKDKIVQMGIKIRPNTLIGPVITVDDLFRDGYKAVFLSTGTWKPKKLDIKGESLGHVHFALDYLKNPDVYNLGRKLVVIGAGNAAMDVARTALRKGVKDVYVFYRKKEEDMSADLKEIEFARIDGVKFEFMKNIVEINDEGVIFIDSAFDDSKKTIFKTDSVIVAISQGPRDNIISTTKGIEISKSGLVYTDKYGRTTRAGVFASGDVVTGPRTVVEAVCFSKKVSEIIDDYVCGIEEC